MFELSHLLKYSLVSALA